MTDYLNDLNSISGLGKSDKFNYLMNIIDSKINSSSPVEDTSNTGDEENNQEDEEIPVVQTGNITVSIKDNTTNDYIANATVTLNGDTDYSNVTNENGETIFEDVIYGSYELNISAEGYNELSENYVMKVESDSIEYSLTRATGDVKVSVSDGTNGINNVNVVISDNVNEYTGTTGSAGGCTIKNVPVGTYTIESSKEGYIANLEDITVVAGENTIAVVLEVDAEG